MKNSETPVTIPAWAVGMQISGVISGGSGLSLQTTTDGFSCTISYYPMRNGGECDVEIAPLESPAPRSHGQPSPVIPHIHGLNLRNIPEARVVAVIFTESIPGLVRLREALSNLAPATNARRGLL